MVALQSTLLSCAARSLIGRAEQSTRVFAPENEMRRRRFQGARTCRRIARDAGDAGGGELSAAIARFDAGNYRAPSVDPAFHSIRRSGFSQQRPNTATRQNLRLERK
jgi:hypothetical protein